MQFSGLDEDVVQHYECPHALNYCQLVCKVLLLNYNTTFFVVIGNGCTTSEGEDVQGTMCLLYSGHGDFLQCSYLWLLGIW